MRKADGSSKEARIYRFTAEGVPSRLTVVPGTRTFAYGHFGDGNVHFNLCAPKGVEASAFMARAADLHRAVCDIAAEYGGSFAAEHGVGIVKPAEMERYRSAVELDLMRGFQAAARPDGLFNPGKVLP